MSALVGLEDLVTALVLGAIEPAIGGVLLRGDKGSAKTTAARALASLLPEGAPFVEIPLGATEDRVVGSVDVAAILEEGSHRFAPGLLHAAHGGVLYVDEINLLADHLVDVLLDAAATGVTRVERDGVSHLSASRFVLVGSMNPEEGELRPQLLDRFGLSVDVRTPVEPDRRAEAVRRRLAFDQDPAAFVATWERAETELAARVRAARPVPLESGLEDAVARLCVAAGAEGLRADLVICRAAGALAAWRGLPRAGAEEVATVAPLALGHRRRTPFATPSSPPPADRDELNEMVRRSLGANQSGTSDGGAGVLDPAPASEPGSEDRAGSSGAAPDPPDAPDDHEPRAGLLERTRRGAHGPSGRRRASGDAPLGLGRSVGSAPIADGGGAVAVGPSVLAATVRSAGALPISVQRDDVRTARHENRGESVVVLAVDTSGSMGAADRVAAARGAVLSLVADAYQRRDRVAVVAYRDRAAQVVLRPTSSTEIALARLSEVPTGGRTPLAAGIDVAREVALAERRKGAEPLLVVVTDGRATWAPDGRDPLEAALDSARACRVARLGALVVDCETVARPLGAARELATAMGARYVSMGAAPVDSGAALAEAISGSLA